MVAVSESRATPRLMVLPEQFAICRLQPGSPVPDWAAPGGFLSVTCTPDEVSVVCPQERVPAGIVCEGGWRAIGLEGPLDLALVGVLASVLAPLAAAGVSVFAVSTYDTDYVLVKDGQLDRAVDALRDRGYQIS